MGLFAEWQPRYAEHGVATFPVTPEKTPAVKGYLKIGGRVSEQLALKFPANDAFGLACKRNRITVLDIDAPDEKLLAEGLDEHGPTPFVVRSGSGNFQCWYRHNGEKRRVRPDPAKPIDILGDGYVVAPPSRGAKGRYEIIQGSLDDLDRLPNMRPVAEPAMASEHTQIVANDTASEKRNDTLWRQCMKMARGCHRIEELMEKAMEHNREAFYQPLPANEVLKIVASAWGYEIEGENWFGRGARVVLEHDVIDDLAAKEPHAHALLCLLRRHHWGREFYLAKAYADKLGWTLRTFKAARAVLLKRGLIECVHPGGRGPNDPPLYRFP